MKNAKMTEVDGGGWEKRHEHAEQKRILVRHRRLEQPDMKLKSREQQLQLLGTESNKRCMSGSNCYEYN